MSVPKPKAQSVIETEPTAGSAPAPVWLFVLLGLLAFWGMLYLDEQGGGFQAQVYRPHASLAELQAMMPKSEGDVLFANGRQIYGTYCSVCHQPTGLGAPPLNPPLAGSDWVMQEGPSRLIRLVLNGVQGPIQVNGQAYNGAMPPWRDLLTDEQIAAVLTFVRQNQGWGNTASAVTPAQVSAIREKTAGRSAAWSPAELLQLPVNE
jgi:mono/diheme cytochrome c family protein